MPLRLFGEKTVPIKMPGNVTEHLMLSEIIIPWHWRFGIVKQKPLTIPDVIEFPFTIFLHQHEYYLMFHNLVILYLPLNLIGIIYPGNNYFCELWFG